jgi:phospholipase/carboxylesterase
MPSITRRNLLGAVPAWGLLRGQSEKSATRISARPSSNASAATPPGLHTLGLRSERDALLYVPESSAKHAQAALVISLHGAGRGAERGIELLRSLADEHGFLLLAPASTGSTWDVIEGGFGPDVPFISRALARVFEIRKVDPSRIAMAGFSDGASYSLTIGVMNGDVFKAVFGFSPGFVVPGEHVGKPPIFISHGTRDQVLPIEACSRRIVPQLRGQGYKVTFREFDGQHTLPPDVAAEAMRWFMEI